ncbi:Brp/Blh family beta-carotene 15,15'-dioxygenase [Hymenobacter psoromatis]|uniref:Brp/Blh family beta-carotene 15,15'-dioxygenase n=1 Tax=Hymenobacter psoromatis TaxID=1484116 RepID=UPI001CBBD291|nr:Brp/Blh family beta-carotene 15,15'-dioxygenase [Hymenobacter psoromatis]
MFAPDPDFTSSWPQRRYSYVAVLALAGLGAVFPAAAWTLLGPPLAVGMVLLGVAHGACDQLVLPAGQPRTAPAGGWRYWLVFLAGYLGLAGLVGGLWWGWPAGTVGLFFLLTVWHWGSADMPGGTRTSGGLWLAHSLLRGLLLFAVPAWGWPVATGAVVNGLLAFAGAATVAAGPFAAAAAGLGMVVVAGHLTLWAGYARRHRWALLRTEAAEVLVLTGLLLALPPQLSVGVYFVFWHSLQHVLRLVGWLGYAPGAGRGAGPALGPQLVFFLRRAAPLLLLSCAALLVLSRLLASRLPNGAAWFSLALVVASLVTLPHALLVTLVMDAPRWRTRHQAE